MPGPELVLYAGAQPRERYNIGGRLGVGVSTVLEESGARSSIPGPAVAVREKAFVGSLVHALVAGWWESNSPKKRYPERVAEASKLRKVAWRPETIEKAAPYWDSFVRLIGMARLLARLWEHQVVVEELPLVCGTFDFWGDFGRRRVLFDIKCRAPLRQGETLQTWAYLRGLRREWTELEPTVRATVYLRPGADPRVAWHNDDAYAEAAWAKAYEKWVELRATAERTRSGKLIEPTEESHAAGEGEGWPGDDGAGDDGPGEEDRADPEVGDRDR